MSNPIKDLRKQLKNLVLEHLPDIFTEELVKEAEARINKQVDERLKALEKQQKDFFGFAIRNMTTRK